MSAAEYLFVTPEPLYTASGRLFARGASARLGSLLPMQGLSSLGYDARAVSIYGGSADAEAQIRQAQCVVFGEMFATPQGWPFEPYRQLLAAVRESTQRAVFYLADDHFDDAQFSSFYSEAFQRCRAVATVSENLAAAIRRFTDKPVLVAPEPCEGLRRAPRASQAPRSLPVIDRLARWAGVSREPWRVHLLWFQEPQPPDPGPARRPFRGRQPAARLPALRRVLLPGRGPLPRHTLGDRASSRDPAAHPARASLPR